MLSQYPKVLTVTRTVWDDGAGTSSTSSNLFGNYDPKALSEIYIETKMPHTKHCNKFFQISEYALIRRIWNKKTKTGRHINTLDFSIDKHPADFEKKEHNIMSFVRQNRSIFYSFLREVLWLFNGWKSKGLKEFITTTNPDVLFIYGSPLILMNRLQFFVLKKGKKPAAYFFMDDIYSYKSIQGRGLGIFIYRFFLRLAVKRVIKHCDIFFVASPKMKKEYDAIFNIDSNVLTKGVNFTNKSFEKKPLQQPIKLVYLGQIIYGRIYSLIAVVKLLKRLNENGIRAQLDIYTGNFIDEKQRSQLEIEGTSRILPLVPYEKVANVIDSADIVVFVESLNKKYKNLARLSFSTKIVDYLSSGKCVFAVGPADVAPIEYLRENDAAIVASSEQEIQTKILALIEDPKLIYRYAEKSYQCAQTNHDIKNTNKLLYESLIRLSKTEK